MVRLIREEEAPRPSLRLSSMSDLPKIAAARKTEPARLSKLVRGEIDWIVMKWLEKDRSRRYETANGVARDLKRYLADEPVEAYPPSSSYRLRKFARKYKKALATAAAFALLLVAGVVMSTLLAVWATSAERMAKQSELEANQQRLTAEVAKHQALVAKAEADRQRDEARLTAYASGMGLAQRAWEENNVARARELLRRGTHRGDKGSHPMDLAFLAMAHQQLGHAKEAEAELQRLRARMKDPPRRNNPRLRASCARRKNCWQNRSCRAPSKQAWAVRRRVQACPCGIETARLLRRAGHGPSAPNHGLSAEGVRFR